MTQAYNWTVILPNWVKKKFFLIKGYKNSTGYLTSSFRLGSIALPARLENENSLLVVTVEQGLRKWNVSI